MAIRAHLFGLPHTTLATALEHLTQFAALYQCVLRPTDARAEDFDVFALHSATSGHLCLFCRWSAWFDLRTFLLHACPTPLLCFHIYEHDFWSYELFVDGVLIDSYISSLAFYPPEEQPAPQELQMKPRTLCTYWPVSPSTPIERYFIPWNADEYPYLSATIPTKAYSEDRYTRGDMWQVADFMHKLGLTFPIAADGTLVGDTFEYISQKAAR